jgi:hypothetical protein
MGESGGKTANQGRRWAIPALGIVVAAIVVGWSLGWFGPRGAARELLAQPAYQVLKRHEPEAWSRVLAAYEAIGNDASRRAEFVNVSNTEFSAAATRRLAQASPDAQLALMRDMVSTLRLLRARSGESCFRYLYPEIAGNADVARELAAEAQLRTLTLSADVIRTAAESPSTPAAPEEAARQLGPIVDAVYAEFGQDTQLLSHAREPGIDRAKVCDIALSLYERILALPPADAARVFSAVASS